MMIGSRIRFTPTLLPTVMTLIVVVSMLGLSRWQSNRAIEKTAQQSVLESRREMPLVNLNAPLADVETLPNRRAVVRGEWLREGQIFLDNKVEGSKPGYYVMTPLMLESSKNILLVNRGWTGRTASYPAPPLVPEPFGVVEIQGILTVPTKKFLELGSDTIQGNVWQNLTLDRYREKMKLDVMPIILLANSASTTLVPVVEVPNAGIEKHQGYAFQWFAMAAGLIIIWLAVNLKIKAKNSMDQK